MQVTNSKPRLDYREISRKQKDYQDHWTKPRRKYILSDSPESVSKAGAPERTNDECIKQIVHVGCINPSRDITTEDVALLENIMRLLRNHCEYSGVANKHALNTFFHNIGPVWILEKPTSSSFESKFIELKEKWQSDTVLFSLVKDKAMHPAYQQIIGMGEDAIPLILRELEQKSGHWFWALSAITGENPIEERDAGLIKQMANAWIEWGRERGYL